MSMRTLRERILQTIAFEAFGIALVSPAYGLVFGASASDTITVIVALSIAAMVWSPLHNTVFDWLDLALTGRVASNRPQRLRIVHAISHEVTILVVTLPLLMALGGHSITTALLVEFGLTTVYTAYAYLFHMAYDRWRPVEA